MADFQRSTTGQSLLIMLSALPRLHDQIKNNLFPCLLSMGNISQTIYFLSPWQTSPVAAAVAFSMATFSKATITFNQKKQLNINLS